MEQKKNSNIKSYIIIFIVAFLPRIILCASGKMGFWPSDETATIAGAAALAGLDWTEVVSKAGYYGQGFYSLFAPLFIITDNPFIIYKVMAVTCAILQGLTAYMAYYCIGKIGDIDEKVKVIISISASYMLNTEASILYNEHPYLVVTWLIMILLLKLFDNIDKPKKKAGYTILLVGVMGYAMTLHTRAWILWMSLVIVVILFYYLYKKWIVSIPVCIALGCGMIAAITVALTVIQKKMWETSDTSTIRNTKYVINITWDALNSVKAWFNIVVGQINAAVFASMGIAIICVVIFVSMFFKAIKNRKAKNDDFEEQKYILIAFFNIFAIMMTIGGLSLSWLSGATEAIKEGFGSNHNSLKIFFYFRYFATFTAPLIMITMIYMYKNKEKMPELYKIATKIYIVIQTYWLIFIVPYSYKRQEYKMARLNPYIGFIFGRKVNIYTFVGALVVLTILWIIIGNLIKRQKIKSLLMLIMVFLVYHYISMSVCYVEKVQDVRYSRINGGYNFVKQLENEDIECYEIFSPSKTDGTICPYFYYQFYLNRHKILPRYPETGNDRSVVLFNEANDELLISMGYRCYELDSNEYVYLTEAMLSEILNSNIDIEEVPR